MLQRGLDPPGPCVPWATRPLLGDKDEVVSFTIETQIWISTTVFVPIKIVFQLLEMQGKMRIGVRKERQIVSFLSNPHMKFHVQSSIGDRIRSKNYLLGKSP